MKNIRHALKSHHNDLKNCNLCDQMVGPPVVGKLVHSSILLVGQAPGVREPQLQKPFGWTAGKTLFGWFQSIGLCEADARELIYITAICRCFPGKNLNGGDRVPNKDEIKSCSRWLKHEIELLRPELVIPVGKLAISQFVSVDRLNSIIGKKIIIECYENTFDIIALPHPSGISTWHKSNQGKLLLEKSLHLIRTHSAFIDILSKL